MSTFSSPKPAPSTESILPCYPQPNTHTHHIQIHRKKSIRSISAVVPISNLSRLKFADLKIFQGRKVRLCFIYEQLRGRCRANGEGFQHLAAKESGRGWGSRRKSEGWHGNLRKEDTDKGHEVRGGSEGDSRAAFPFTLAGESRKHLTRERVLGATHHTQASQKTLWLASVRIQTKRLYVLCLQLTDCIWIIVLHLKDITIRMYTVWQPRSTTALQKYQIKSELIRNRNLCTCSCELFPLSAWKHPNWSN